ncbi:MAG: GNAT family N-acetyltransferase [Dermatophilaceae bacterium]
MPRVATAADVPALAALRVAMFDAMGVDSSGAEFRARCTRWFAEHLDDPDVRIVVADDPDGMPVSCAVAQVRPAPPSPSGHSGELATIFNVVTLAAYRKRGYAAACFDALLDWVDARSDVQTVELLATPEGRGLYSSRGFVTHPHPLMRRRGIPRLV